MLSQAIIKKHPQVRDKEHPRECDPVPRLRPQPELTRLLHSNITSAPSNANNPELTTNRPAPFVEELPAAVPVPDALLLLPVAAGPAVPPVDPVTDGCEGTVVRDDAETEGEGALTDAVLDP
jgi:hypothetical protein